MSISKQIKRLAGESAIYGVAGIFSRFVNLFLFPFYSKVLPPAEYGIIGMYNSTFLFFFVIVSFAMDSATFRFYFDANNEIENQRKTFSNWFFFQLFLSLLLCSFILVANNFWSSFIFKGYANASYITKWLTPVIILYATPTILEVWYRLQRKAVAAVTYSVVTTALSIIVSLFCILKFHLGVLGFIYGQMAGYSLGTIYGLIVLRKWISFKNIDLLLLKKMLNYALPLLPAGLASTALLFASNYYLKARLNFSELGLYSIGNTLASSLGLITMAFGQAWSPFAFSISRSKSAPKTYSAVFTSFCIILSLACLVFCMFLPDILKLITNKNYYGAEIVGCILSFNVFFMSTTIIGMTGCGIAKKTAPYAKAVIIGGVISLVSIFVLGNFIVFRCNRG
ncbi:MAG: oligosaccharide flippase family protein, partial [Ginsengibacter sp.]